MSLGPVQPRPYDLPPLARQRVQVEVIDQLHQCLPPRWISPCVSVRACALWMVMNSQNMARQTPYHIDHSSHVLTPLVGTPKSPAAGGAWAKSVSMAWTRPGPLVFITPMLRMPNPPGRLHRAVRNLSYSR